MSGGLRHPRFLAFLGVFVAGTALAATGFEFDQALVIGFDLAALVFLASCVPLWRNDRLAAMQARAARDDGGRMLLLVVSIITLATVMAALARMILGRGDLVALQIGLVVVSMALAWLFINLIYTFHYANLYHLQKAGRPNGGLEFPGGGTPLFADFCYFSFVIGMTCQVSDVAITSTEIRRVATGQGLIAYVFNLGVLALTINIVAGFVGG